MSAVRTAFAAFALTAALVSLPAVALLAQSTARVQFAAGNDNAAIRASVTGDEYRDYLLGARAGQAMSVSLTTDGSAYFNILPPGSTGEEKRPSMALKRAGSFPQREASSARL